MTGPAELADRLEQRAAAAIDAARREVEHIKRERRAGWAGASEVAAAEYRLSVALDHLRDLRRRHQDADTARRVAHVRHQIGDAQ